MRLEILAEPGGVAAVVEAVAEVVPIEFLLRIQYNQVVGGSVLPVAVVVHEGVAGGEEVEAATWDDHVDLAGGDGAVDASVGVVHETVLGQAHRLQYG